MSRCQKVNTKNLIIFYIFNFYNIFKIYKLDSLYGEQHTDIRPIVIETGFKRGRGLTQPEQKLEANRRAIISEIVNTEYEYGTYLAFLYKVRK